MLVRDSLVDQSMLFTHLYLMLGEKIEAWILSQQAENILVLNPQLFCLLANSQRKSIHCALVFKMNC